MPGSLDFYPGEAVTLLKDFKQQRVVIKFALRKAAVWGMDWRQARQTAEASCKAVAVILERAGEGLDRHSDGGNGLER